MRVQIYEITIPKAKFFTPRLEPAYVIPIIKAAWKDQTPDEDGIIATPVPFCREVSQGDEWDRLAMDYGDAAKSIYPSDHALRRDIEVEAERLTRSGLVPLEGVPYIGNIPLTMVPNLPRSPKAAQVAQDEKPARKKPGRKPKVQAQ